MNTKFNRERIRFDVKQPDTLVIQGWFEDDTEGAEQFEAERNGAPAAIDLSLIHILTLPTIQHWCRSRWWRGD